MNDPTDPDPCVSGKHEDGSIDYDHEWKFVDDSFSHEFGTQVIHYDICTRCGEKRDCEPYEDD